LGEFIDFFLEAWMPMRDLAARKYLAGARIDDALKVCVELEEKDILTTVSYWDRREDSIQDILRENHQILNRIEANGLDSYLSFNLSALRVGEGLQTRILEALVQAGQDRRLLIHLDAMGYGSAQKNWDVLESIVKKGNLMGGTLPARWNRSMQDALRLGRQNVRLRLVKGNQFDPLEKNGKVFSQKQFRQRYLKLVDCLKGRSATVAVATHDYALACESLSRLQGASTPCELELRYQVSSSRLVKWAQNREIPVRFYVPYGTPHFLDQRFHPRDRVQGRATDLKLLKTGLQNCSLSKMSEPLFWR